MKKILAALLTCAAFAVFTAGCQKSEQSDTSCASVPGEGQLLSVPTVEEVTEIASSLIDRAAKLFFVYHDETPYHEFLPAGTVVTVDGVTATLPRDFYFYKHVSEELGEINTLDDLRNATLSTYTIGTAQERLFDNYFEYEAGDELPKFVEHEGKLYVGAGGMGNRYEYNNETIKILHRRADTVVFTVNFEAGEYNEAGEEVLVDQETHLFVMKNTENGWRLDTFYGEIQVTE